MHCKIIPENCIACGLCQIYAPEIFDYNDEGIVLLKKHSHKQQQVIPSQETDNVRIAYRKCPVRAIELTKEN